MRLQTLLQVAVTVSVAHALERKVTPQVVSPKWYAYPKEPSPKGDWYVKPALIPEPVTPYEKKIRSATKWNRFLGDPHWMMDVVQHESQAEPCDHEQLAKELAAAKSASHEQHNHPLSVVILLIFVVLMVLFAFSQTKRPNVSANTIIVIDNVVAIFVAVMWFSAFEDLCDHYFPKTQLAVHTTHFVILMGMVFWGAFLLRYDRMLLPAFCASGGHFAQFGGTGASLHYQKDLWSTNVALCFMGFLILFAGLLLLGVLSFYAKKVALGVTPGQKNSSDPKLMANEGLCDKLDTVETAVSSMSLAIYLGKLLQFAVIGSHDTKNHTAGQRLMMLGLALLGGIVGFALIHMIATMKKSSYFMARLCMLMNAFIVMTVVYLFTFWGKMLFFESHVIEHEGLSRILYTTIFTVSGMIGLFLVSNFERTAEVNDLLMGAGLLIGMSWHAVFEKSFDVICDKYNIPNHLLKPILALVLMAIVLPIWMSYLKPLSMNAAKLPKNAGTGFVFHHGIDEHDPDKK